MDGSRDNRARQMTTRPCLESTLRANYLAETVRIPAATIKADIGEKLFDVGPFLKSSNKLVRI